MAADNALVPTHLRDSENVKLVGRVADPRPYYEAADICLESFPMPSMGALIEAVAIGQAFPVPAFGASETPVRVNLHALDGVVVRRATETDYVRHVCELIAAPGPTREVAAELRRTLIHEDEAFGDQFTALYEQAEGLGHAPHKIPESDLSSAPENLVLASLTDLGDVGEALNCLPSRSMITARAHAVIAGYESPRAAGLNMARKWLGPAFRRLPERLRRRPASR
jgi:hypothetical protein